MDPQVAAKNQPSTWGPINYQPQYNYIYIYLFIYLYTVQIYSMQGQ